MQSIYKKTIQAMGTASAETLVGESLVHLENNKVRVLEQSVRNGGGRSEEGRTEGSLGSREGQSSECGIVQAA